MSEDEFYRFWRTTEGAGPAERRVIAEFHRLTWEQQTAEAAHWVTARMQAVVEDQRQAAAEDELQNPS